MSNAALAMPVGQLKSVHMAFEHDVGGWGEAMGGKGGRAAKCPKPG